MNPAAARHPAGDVDGQINRSLTRPLHRPLVRALGRRLEALSGRATIRPRRRDRDSYVDVRAGGGGG